MDNKPLGHITLHCVAIVRCIVLVFSLSHSAIPGSEPNAHTPHTTFQRRLSGPAEESPHTRARKLTSKSSPPKLSPRYRGVWRCERGVEWRLCAGFPLALVP